LYIQGIHTEDIIKETNSRSKLGTTESTIT
jgi:hypothetical protein